MPDSEFQNLLLASYKFDWDLAVKLEGLVSVSQVPDSEWDESTLYNNPKWQHSFREGGRTGEVVVFVGNTPLFAYNKMSKKEKKKIKYEGEGRVLFINMGQAFHYLPDFKERKELYAERDGEWFKVAHNFWRLGEGCKITIPKYFL